MKFWLFSILLVTSFGASAQGLYRGGKGGGWASASHQLIAKPAFDLRIYSPSGAYLAVIQGVPTSSEGTVYLYDCLGRQLGGGTLKKGDTRVNLSDSFGRGVYLLVVEAEKKRFVKRVAL